MKLHLPIALLTAVVSAMSYAHADINRELSGTPVTGATHGDLTVTITGNDDYTTTNMYTNNKPGYIGGAAHYEASGKENTLEHGGNPADLYSSLNMIVGGEGSNPTLKYLMLEGLTVNSVVGDKSVTVNSGTIEILYGGIVYLSGVKSGNLSHTGNAIGDNYYPYKDSSNPANTSITINGGTVGHIRGGHSGKQEDYVYKVLSAAQTYDKEHGTNTYGELMANKPWSISGNVNIAVNGGVIEAANAGKTTAIMGAGGSGHSVDGTVNVSVSGGTVLGDIFAGSNNIYSEVGATHVEISGGAITGNVYGGGDIDDGRTEYASYTDAPAPTVKGGTTVVLSGGTIDGNVYAAGVQDIVNAGANNVGTHVVISGDGTEVTGTISGLGVDSTVEGDRLLTIENSGGKNVNWDKIEGFNAVEFKGSEIKFGTLSQDFEKVSAEGSWLQGSFEDGEVELKANDSFLQIAGNLTTTDGSSITNTRKPMTVGGDATFQGTEIENADLVAGGDMGFEGSSMNGGSISVGGKLTLLSSDVKAQVATTDGSAVLVESVLSDLTVDGSIKLADGSSFTGLNYDQIQTGILNKMSTVTADSIEIGNNLHSDYSSFTATEGGITIGSGASLEHSHLNAKGDITIEQATLSASDTPEGYTPYGSSEVTSSEGNISIGAGSTLTNTDLTAEKGSVNLTSSTMNGGNIVAGESVVINDSKVTSTTLTAGQNVSIADSTVSGSKITASAGDLTVSGSTVTDTQLNAGKGTITMSGSTYINSNDTTEYITGKEILFKDSAVLGQAGPSNVMTVTTFIKGNTTAENSTFQTDTAKSHISFGGNLTADAETKFIINAGALKFNGSEVTLNGSTITNNGGTLESNAQIVANGGNWTLGGTNKFSNIVQTNGTVIDITGTAKFNDDLVLSGGSLTSKSNSKLEFAGDVTASGTTISTSATGGNLIFNGNVYLNGDTALQVTDNANRTIEFNGSTVTSTGNNTISGDVDMGANTVLTASNGMLTINANNNHGCQSTLSNLQVGENGKIDVTATYGKLTLNGTSSITNLSLNGMSLNAYIKGDVTVSDKVTINNDSTKGHTTYINGKLTATELVSTGGKIVNEYTGKETFGLVVHENTQLTDTTFTNNKGVVALKGTVDVANSSIVNNAGSIQFRGSVDSEKNTYQANGGEIWFCNQSDNTLVDTNSKFIANEGATIQFGQNNPPGRVEFNGSDIVTNGGTVQFNCAVDANAGTKITANDGEIHFNKLLDINGGTITKGTDGTITFHRDVVAENTQIIVNGGSMHFDGNLVKNIALNGGNEIKANGSGTLMFSQGSTATITANGNNTIDAGFIMGTGNQLVAESGVLNITNGAEDSNNSLTLVNVKIADDAAVGTKINVTANKGQGKLEIGGSSSISNLTVNGANSTIKGDLDIAEKLVVNNATSGSMTVTETGALTAENAEINGSSLVNEGTANLKNVALTDGSSVSNTGETLELGAATVSGSVSIKHNTDGTTKIGGITKTDDSASVSLSQTGGTVEFNGGKGTVAEIDWYNSDVSDAAMVQSGDGTVNVGHVISSDGTVEFKQTGNGEMNFGGMWINMNTNYEINQTGKGHINFSAAAANVGSVTQSGGGTFTYDAPSSRILSLDISNGSTFEAMCSVELDDVAISDATLFNAGTMTMDSLVMDNATLLFAASALDSCSSFIFNGDGGLTGYGISNVSAADMIKEIGIVMSGADANGLLQQWGSEVEFAFTLAQGSELFEKEFAYVLEQNLAEFTITLGEAAELSFADGEIKDITVEDTENGVVVKGIAVIPEPTTATLSLLALAALAARRRRK